MRNLCRSMLVVAVIASVMTVGSAMAAQNDTIFVSRAGGFGPAGDGNSSGPSISADGRFVAFESGAANLDPDSNDAFFDVFVRDLVSNTTTLVSRASGAAGTGGDADSFRPSISADGRFVAFDSDAANLDVNESNDAVRDVFVRDLVSNTTTLVSRATGATGAGGDGGSARPSISADGRFVAFDSGAGNLDVDESNDGVLDVFVRDLASDTTTLVSRASGAAGTGGDGGSFRPSISADGRFVAFDSGAANLDVNESNDNFTDVYVRDLASSTTTLVSRATGATGAGGDANSFSPSISADGRFVAFHSGAGNLDVNESNDAFRDVYVRDVVSNTTTLVSRASGATGAGGDEDSENPSISADGRFVAFESFAANLDVNESNDAFLDVFVRDVRGPQAPPALEINNFSSTEGRAATTKPFTFTVSLDGVPGRTVTVDFATKNGTATLGDNDYRFTNGTLTFFPGQTTKQVVVTVNGDRKREKSETFRVKIFNAVGAEIEDGTGIGTIRNDDR